MDEMNRVSDYIDVFLQDVYSEDEGWTCWEFPQIGKYTPDYIFELEGNAFGQIVVRIPDSIITEEHIVSAEGLIALFKTKFPAKEAKLLLACGELLVDPPELPSDIVAISIFEEALGYHETIQWEHNLN